ncbi:hypothetical protein ACQP2P_22825 [Dactylosporangium sp. CA-139114]|uniref:hypothetical protein n=1 Tax=Dactylosporangium sp. CA-139114 TaxID=3239931 RepID=UPI003D98C949
MIRSDVAAAVATVLAVAELASQEAEPEAVLDALALLRAAQAELERVEPELVAAARRAGVSWQALAPALGVASRQAAERRYLRAATSARAGDTKDGRVRAERDHRAGARAVARWADDHAADLRRIAGQVSGLTDLPAAAGDDVGRLHDALGHADAGALPDLLGAVRRHLGGHPGLGAQIDRVAADTEAVLRRTRRQRER